MSNQNSHLLEEYKELGLCWRHDDEAFSKLTAVLLPLSIGALTLPYLKTGAPKLLAASGGLMLMAFWAFLSELLARRLKIRFSRIHELERILEFDSHLRYHTKIDKRVWKAQLLRRWVFIVYIVIAFFVTCYIKVESTDIIIGDNVRKFGATLATVAVWTTPNLWFPEEWIVKLVITVETLVYLIIAATVVRIWVWICKRDSKDSSPENEA